MKSRTKVSVLLVVCLTVALTAHAAVTGSGTVPVSTTVANPCISEAVAFSGIAHFVSTSTRSADGVLTVGLTFDFSGIHGVGLQTGQQYVLSVVEIDHVTVTGRGGATSTFIESITVSGPGGRFLFHFVGHVTINDNGTVTVSFSDPTSDC
jgi:hypothetical protein